jgi:tRNA threonylcarbamoyladenosine biosynthesis protein TsaB
LYTLGLETSTRAPGAALLGGEALLGSVYCEPGKQASARFPVLIRDLLASHGVAPRDIGLLAVSIGPGSFTGLRVGVTLAKTWAWATGAKLVAVPTLEAVGRGVLATALPPGSACLRVASDAQRQQFFLQSWQLAGGGPVTGSAVQIVDRQQLTQDFPASGLLVLSGLTSIQPAWPATRVLYVHPDPAAVASLGLKMFNAGQTTTPLELIPRYGRDSAATERKAHGAAAAGPAKRAP